MPELSKVPNLAEALDKRTYPTITTWNRLEGRPRTASFERVLQAEVRDALWMLTKQWQMGEFRGSDTGSPIFAKLQADTTRLTKYRPASQETQLFEYAMPLEAKVERRPLPLTMGGQAVALDLRLMMGHRWLKLIAGIGNYRQAFIAAYPFVAPDPTQRQNADLCAHPEVLQQFTAVAGRAMDGAALYAYLTAAATNHAYDGLDIVASAERAALDDCAARFVAWFQRQFVLPPTNEDNAWCPERLEYQFAVSAPVKEGEKIYVADEYHQGRLDWYSLDIDTSQEGLISVPGETETGLPPASPQTTLPIPISFTSMPNTRWWSFEDQKTNFGDISASTTDLAKLLFIEFALVYANDWFLIPYTLPEGAIATIRGLVVTDVFGEHRWILAADEDADTNWQRWSMFTNNQKKKGAGETDTSLLHLPTVPKVQEGPAMEEILFIKDEVANMVWGIEQTIPLATGERKAAIEAVREKLAFFRSLLPPQKGEEQESYKAALRYQVMSTVPENWIPFLPVHVPGSERTIQLQRAALPRILPGDSLPPVKVQPRTMLLREGLDQIPARPYFLYNEEIPRAGTRISQAFQRARWHDGRVFTWLGVRKQTGRGEGASGLAFDELLEVPPGS